jgi:rhodanese-related sulfurtransferase
LIETISVTELAAQRASPGTTAMLVLDVREAWEVETAKIAGTLHLPMSALLSRIDEIPKDQPIAVLCHHGARSLQVAHYLARQGFGPLYNIDGGIDAWSRQVDPAVPTY